MTNQLTLRVPASKSLTMRGLLLSALAAGESRLINPLDCDDTRVLRVALRQLGAQIFDENQDFWLVRGGCPAIPQTRIFCGDAGAAIRFLAPLSLLLDGELILEGSAQLCRRPIAELIDALKLLGVQANYLGEPGFPPVKLRRGGAIVGRTTLEASRSSQFVSALLMVGPCLKQGLAIELAGEAVSRPYIDLTLQAMDIFGASVEQHARSFTVAPAGYRAASYIVEGDWSSAAFWLAAGQITSRPFKLENIDEQSRQGDRQIADFIKELKQPRSHHFDLSSCPDLLAPLAVAAVLATHPSRLFNVGHARLKESDRLAVLAHGLREVGVQIDEQPDSLSIVPTKILRGAIIDPHGDHRMAMAFGLLSLHQPSIKILNPQCVSKSYPEFWSELERWR